MLALTKSFTDCGNTHKRNSRIYQQPTMVVANHQGLLMADRTNNAKKSFSIAFLLDLCSTKEENHDDQKKIKQLKKNQNTMDEDEVVEGQSLTDDSDEALTVEEYPTTSTTSSPTTPQSQDHYTTMDAVKNYKQPPLQTQQLYSPENHPHSDNDKYSPENHHLGLLLNPTAATPSQIWLLQQSKPPSIRLPSPSIRSPAPSILSPPLLVSSLHNHHQPNHHSGHDNDKEDIGNSENYKLSLSSSSTDCLSYDGDNAKG